MLKRFFLAVLAMGMASAMVAQTTFSLQGSLKDSKGEPMMFTNCVLLQLADSAFAYGTTSDLDGVFSLTGVKQGDYILRITAVGYETWWLDITIDRDTNLGTIEIADNATLLHEVKITASRPLYSADGEKVFYNVSDDPSVQSGNATDALQNAPGVEVDAEGNIKYRGGAEVSIWINDKPSHLKAEGLKQYLKSLPAGTLQRIEVIAHPSAKYHTKNCVINIVTTAKVKRNELLCLGLNANSRPQVGPWVDYVWANEKVRFNLFVSGDIRKHYFTVSPDFHASYTTESMHNFTFSYTHYVAPPTAAQLTRFTVYGYDSYSTGNPALRKGYADNLELGWERYFDHLGSIGLSAWYNSDRDHTGTLTDVAFCDRFGRIVAFTQTANIGTARQGGIGLNATLRPLDFMNIRFYANLFDDYYRLQYRPGMWQESEMLCYSLRLNFWTKILEHTSASWFDG